MAGRTQTIYADQLDTLRSVWAGGMPG